MKKVIYFICAIVIILLIIFTKNIFSNEKKKTMFNNPILPEGFKKVETQHASWKIENGIPKGWNDGLVIEDSNDNQFVWVPVDVGINHDNKDVNQIYVKEQLDMNELEDLQIYKYGGFYVSRFEAGVSLDMQNELNNIDESKNDIIDIPQSKSNIRPWNYISLKNAKLSAEKMYNTEFLKSGLLTNKQWNSILNWIEYEESGKIGNYSNVNFGFTGLYSIDDGKNYQYAEQKSKSQYNMILSSGATERNMTKNIYDLAGNLAEYTGQYIKNMGYVIRGGNYDNIDNYSVSSTMIGTKADNKFGFRVVLYIK